MKKLLPWILCWSSLLMAGCGTADAPVADEDDTTSTTAPGGPASTRSAPTQEGAPITVPVCDFVGMTPETATTALGFAVIPSSDVGKDPSGGTCNLTPAVPAADHFEVAIAVYPDTADGFDSFIKSFTAKKNKGRSLWTPPEPVPDLGETAYTFGSPEGGFDAAWVFADGYRIMVSDKNKTDVAGARAKLKQVASAAAAEVGAT